jgi:DNA ligase-associated metallophosphoesterase
VSISAALCDPAAATALISFAGETFMPLLSGGLYWPAEATLLVADLHLQKFSSFAGSGQLLPPYDTALTLARLAADLEATGARRVVALGDSFHRDDGDETLLAADRLRLEMLLRRADWLWLAGNHDPAPHRLGGLCRPSHAERTITLAHEPRRGLPGLVAGHLHPAAHVQIKGRSLRRPCFVHDGALMILPAYGTGAGSINILGPAFAGLFERRRLEVTMLGRDRLYPVPRWRLVG